MAILCLNSRCSYTCYGSNIFPVPTFLWRCRSLWVKCDDYRRSWWDIGNYSRLYEMERAGVLLYFLQFTIYSNTSGEGFFFCTPVFLRYLIISVVLHCIVTCGWKLVSGEYKRPAIGQRYYVSFQVPGGQNSASSSWALCYDWLNACPCGECVSECFYSMYLCGGMKRLQMEGRVDQDAR